MGRRKITASPSRVVKRERKPSAAVAPKRRGFSSVQQMMISSTAAADLDADSSASSYPSESVLEIKSVLPKREPLVTKIAQPSIMQSATLIPPQNILEEQTRELSYGRSAVCFGQSRTLSLVADFGDCRALDIAINTGNVRGFCSSCISAFGRVSYL